MTNRENNKKIESLLKAAIAPVRDAELRRDLWPEMLQKLSQQPVRVPWFDWALAAILSVLLVFFPGAIPALLYHL
jgi:hypothetical protein